MEKKPWKILSTIKILGNSGLSGCANLKVSKLNVPSGKTKPLVVKGIKIKGKSKGKVVPVPN
jgi:hypothetical protein